MNSYFYFIFFNFFFECRLLKSDLKLHNREDAEINKKENSDILEKWFILHRQMRLHLRIYNSLKFTS